MRNLIRLAMYAAIGFLTWWSHHQRAHLVDVATLDSEYRALCARPW